MGSYHSGKGWDTDDKNFKKEKTLLKYIELSRVGNWMTEVSGKKE